MFQTIYGDSFSRISERKKKFRDSKHKFLFFCCVRSCQTTFSFSQIFICFCCFFKSASRREKQKHQKITKHRGPVAHHFLDIFVNIFHFLFPSEPEVSLSLATASINILYISFLPVLGASYKKYWDAAAVTRNDGITQSASAVGDSFVIIGGEKKK